MKKYKSSLMLVFTIIAALFILNMIVMYVFFNINILDPQASLQDEIKMTGTGSNETVKTELDSNITENGALPENKTINNAEANTTPKSGVSDADLYYMTPDEIASLGHLGPADKLAALTILSKLGVEELNRIYKMSLDGVTFEEFEDMNASAEGKLAVSDIETLKEILYRNKILYAESDR